MSVTRESEGPPSSLGRRTDNQVKELTDLCLESEALAGHTDLENESGGISAKIPTTAHGYFLEGRMGQVRKWVAVVDASRALK